MTETVWPAKPKIFPSWPFTEQVCQPCSRQLEKKKDSFCFRTVLFYDIIFHLCSILNLLWPRLVIYLYFFPDGCPVVPNHLLKYPLFSH